MRDNVPGNPVTVTPSSGTLPPRGCADLRISFAPVLPEYHVFQLVDVTAVGGNTVEVATCGFGVGRKVHVSPQLLQFGNVPVGGKVSRVVTFANVSTLPAHVQLLGDACTTFSVHPPTIEVLPGLTANITVNFLPTHPINYHQSATFLLLHGDPLVVTLLGTGNTPEV